MSHLRLTIPHYFDFGADRSLVGDDLVRPDAWDALRTGTEGPFSLPATREAWEKAADDRPEIGERARVIAGIAEQRGVKRLASYGVGSALPEQWLHRIAPSIELVVTDYAPATVERLAGLFPEAEVLRHDLLADPPQPADLHLFHRIDTELTNKQWRTVMRGFANATVLVVATEIIDLRRAAVELRGRLRNRRSSRAGWIRTREAFEALWRPTHDAQALRIGDHDGWLLEPRR